MVPKRRCSEPLSHDPWSLLLFSFNFSQISWHLFERLYLFAVISTPIKSSGVFFSSSIGEQPELHCFWKFFHFFHLHASYCGKNAKIQYSKFWFGNLAFPVAPSSAWHVSTVHWISFNGLLLPTRGCWKLRNFSSSQKLIRSSIFFVQNSCYFLSKQKFPEDRNCRWKHWKAIFFQNARLFY